MAAQSACTGWGTHSISSSRAQAGLSRSATVSPSSVLPCNVSMKSSSCVNASTAASAFICAWEAVCICCWASSSVMTFCEKMVTKNSSIKMVSSTCSCFRRLCTASTTPSTSAPALKTTPRLPYQDGPEGLMTTFVNLWCSVKARKARRTIARPSPVKSQSEEISIRRTKEVSSFPNGLEYWLGQNCRAREAGTATRALESVRRVCSLSPVSLLRLNEELCGVDRLSSRRAPSLRPSREQYWVIKFAKYVTRRGAFEKSAKCHMPCAPSLSHQMAFLK
mmetsp:Transcript_89356/g.154723  ORF Transcript_89356/g.154723 Transcript_89356/m.154723 type:complete len:278 (+) Transcript_89356:2188-3021(+)